MESCEREAFLSYASLPRFERRVEESLRVIEEALVLGDACVCVSWGKDSVVMLHLCQCVRRDILGVSFGHPERGLISNYAEVERRYCDRFGARIETIAIDGDHVPDKVRVTRLWERYPVNFIGLRKEESKRRASSLSKFGLIYQYQSGMNQGSWRACPIGWWTWTDVWTYICSRDLPYLEIYDRLTRDRGRTTDHLSKTTEKDWQQRRLGEFKQVAPDYYRYLLQNYPGMFY